LRKAVSGTLRESRRKVKVEQEIVAAARFVDGLNGISRLGNDKTG
jgi:hypothetical protein